MSGPERGFDPLANPYPGLRPFDRDEVDLFFGRESQVDELLRRLQASRFLAVLGPSGSGKSSLVRAGLLPALAGGFMTKAGSSWRIAVFRPEDDPVGNLAGALAAPGVLASSDDPEIVEMERLLLETALRGSLSGISDAVRDARLPQGENVLLLVDQFEELFRYARGGDDDLSDDPTLFAQLLIRATQATADSVYVVLTMRSDFLGDCTRIPGLAETINDGIYLIPQFTREERQRAIEGPVGVRGRTMSRGLVLRLLNDLGDRDDRLPILQHAMMRTWEEWRRSGRTDEPLELDHYEAIGGVDEALSRHADSVYRGLESERDRDIARAMFKRLTLETEGRGVRRPTAVKEIARVASASTEDVARVAKPFRERAQSFLLPPLLNPDGTERELTDETVLDISHESLMRVWRDLDRWVAEETENRQRYLELAEAAELHQKGEKAFLVEPELDIFLAWWDKARPTEVWATQYDASFQRARLYLENSRAERDEEARRVEERRKRHLFLLRAALAAAALVAIVFVVLLVSTVTAQGSARVARLAADSAVAVAGVAQDSARIAQDSARIAGERADSLRRVAEAAATAARADSALAEEALGRAEVARARADSLTGVADSLSTEVATAADSARAALERARDAQAAAAAADSASRGLRLAAVARRLALEASRQPSPRLQRLTALQAFALQADSAGEGTLQDRDLYRALAEALDPTRRVVPAAHADQVRAAAFAPDGRWVVSVDNAGALCRTAVPALDGEAPSGAVGDGGEEARRPDVCARAAAQPLRAVAISPGDGDWIAAGAQDGSVLLWDAGMATAGPRTLSTPLCEADEAGCTPLPPRALAFVEEAGATTLSALTARGELLRWSFDGDNGPRGPPERVALEWAAGVSPSAAVFSPAGERLVVGGADGSWAIFRTSDGARIGGGEGPRGTRISAVALAAAPATAPGSAGPLALGFEDGSILCFECTATDPRVELPGHGAAVTALVFADDQLVSGSLDRTVRIWSPADGSWVPLSEHTGWVWSVDAASGGAWILSGSADRSVRIWRTLTRDLAGDVYVESCLAGDGELSDEEWDILPVDEEEYRDLRTTFAAIREVPGCGR